jgi:type IV pilus assembly protein PilP
MSVKWMRDRRGAVRYLGLAAAVVLLTGCAERRMDDLERYASQVLARKGSKIQELPPLEAYEIYTYASTGEKDPFEPFYEPDSTPSQAAMDAATGGGISPDTTRNREDLEQYALDSLRMMGTLELTDGLWGIVRSPDGTIHRVQLGNYMGRNHGKIVSIAEDRIELNEIIPNGQNGWQERSAALGLFE